ncbi:ABC transporter ATP-binding protein [Kallotenue papyrolyticum]|uniref:ABC transporter ATP-binding protein n=1 Tax=Kallotenue papyrolyticum TaxID=1325125 RepID=UPI0004785717|nr:ABC transporter ATP-binding protein [Kallotenue papyrolyticum]
MAAIELEHVSKTYRGQAQPAVDDLSLQVAEGELLVLLGPSGCGKTTTLRLIAGFERPDQGTIRIGDELVAGPNAWIAPERRGVGIVFQDYALFPHLTVAQNVAFGVLRLNRQERAARVAAVLEAVGLSDYAERYPHELSGGQQQRVALARALAPQPRLLLLDEPFSNLDPELRHSLRYEVRAIVRRAGVTTVLVTHDQSEAFALADRIAVMHQGRVHQVADPETLYRRPASRFVAGFVGRAQFIAGVVSNGHVATELGAFRLPQPLPQGARAEALLRPDDLHIRPDAYGPARVVGREFGGASVRYRVQLPSLRVIDVIQPSAHLIALDTPVRVEVLPEEPVVFPADSPQQTPEPAIATARGA